MGSEQAPYWTSDGVTLHLGDCIQVMEGMPDNSVDAIVTDPPYGLEFMGREWDSFKESAPADSWRSDAGMSKPGIGERQTEWPSYGRGDNANATCAACGGRMRGKKQCTCEEPQWRVKGKMLDTRQPGDEDYTAGPGPFGRMTVRHGTADSYKPRAPRENVPTTDAEGSTPYSRARVEHGTANSYFGSGYTEKPRWGGRPESTDRRGQMNVPNFYVAGRAFQDWCSTWVPEALRVLKPGGHIVAFGGTRTFHRLACALEDGGFEIRDALADLTGIAGPGLLWMYGQGFPKSLNVSKAIDRHLGAEREVTGTKKKLESYGKGEVYGGMPDKGGVQEITAPGSEQSAQWEGWGTALKPSWEPIILARKPIERSVAYNIMKYGTGALNVDGCRLDGIKDVPASVRTKPGTVYGDLTKLDGTTGGFDPFTGRWPPNAVLAHSADCQVIGKRKVKGSRVGPSGPVPGLGSTYALNGARPERGIGDEERMEEIETWACAEGCPVRELDQQSGVRPAGSMVTGAEPSDRMGSNGIYGKAGPRAFWPGYGDTGGASRFFPVFRYEAKATTAERPKDGDTLHPTVKPVGLMEWLVRLVTPPGGIVLDPFAGSGTTGEACIINHFDVILIEKDEAYCRLIEKRLTKPIQAGLF